MNYNYGIMRENTYEDNLNNLISDMPLTSIT